MVISIDNCYNIIYNYVNLRTISNKLMIMIQEIYSNMIFNNIGSKSINYISKQAILLKNTNGVTISNSKFIL